MQSLQQSSQKRRAASTSSSRDKSEERPPSSSNNVRTTPVAATASMRAELLQKERVMPRTDVPSKLKAMLQQDSQKSAAAAAENRRPMKAAGKWDGIMEKIAEGQRRDEIRARKDRRAKAAVERQRSG